MCVLLSSAQTAVVIVILPISSLDGNRRLKLWFCLFSTSNIEYMIQNTFLLHFSPSVEVSNPKVKTAISLGGIVSTWTFVAV